MATLTDYVEMVHIITNAGFSENVVSHATGKANYLLKRTKGDSEDYLTSIHFFQYFVSTIEDHLLTYKNIFTLSQLLELFFAKFLSSDRKESYTSQRLQQLLERHFGELIIIQLQPIRSIDLLLT